VPANLTIGPASGLTSESLAALFTAVYEGYWFPIRLDGAAFEQMARTLELDLASSPVAAEDGRKVGLAMLGVRGDEGWVGGMGVVPDRRRAGVGRRLMGELVQRARSRGLARVTLEVLEQNEPARRLYEQLGFTTTRMLDVWTLPAPGGDRTGPAPTETGLDEALASIAALRAAPEPWQRATATIERYRELDDATRAVALDGGAAVFRLGGGRVAILQVAAPTAETAEALLAGVLAGTDGGLLLNLPGDDPAAPALERLGGEVAARQYEMELSL
jgi:ribosomal protein S18 acetylase RimI-like enzyme